MLAAWRLTENPGTRSPHESPPPAFTAAGTRRVDTWVSRIMLTGNRPLKFCCFGKVLMLASPEKYLAWKLLFCVAALITTAAAAPAEAAAADKPVTLTVDYGDGAQKHFTQIPFKKGMTVLAALEAAQKHPHGITFKHRSSGSTAFLLQIDDVENEGGSGRHWIFRLNDKIGDRSFAIQELSPGDAVLWRFEKYQ